MNTTQFTLLVIFAFLAGGAFREFLGDLRPLLSSDKDRE